MPSNDLALRLTKHSFSWKGTSFKTPFHAVRSFFAARRLPFMQVAVPNRQSFMLLWFYGNMQTTEKWDISLLPMSLLALCVSALRSPLPGSLYDTIRIQI
jgi:hypothetical protein